MENINNIFEFDLRDFTETPLFMLFLSFIKDLLHGPIENETKLALIETVEHAKSKFLVDPKDTDNFCHGRPHYVHTSTAGNKGVLGFNFVKDLNDKIFGYKLIISDCSINHKKGSVQVSLEIEKVSEKVAIVWCVGCIDKLSIMKQNKKGKNTIVDRRNKIHFEWKKIRICKN